MRPDTAVGLDNAGKAVGIRGLQLGELAVVDYFGNNRMLSRQAVEHVDIGGIARLGLAVRRKTEPVEKQLSELLGRIDVEFAAGKLVYLGAQRVDDLAETYSEAGQSAAVDEEAAVFHIRENAAKRQLYIAVQRAHALFVDERSGEAENIAYAGGVLLKGFKGLGAVQKTERALVIVNGRAYIAVEQSAGAANEIVSRFRGIEHICRQGGVEYKIAEGDAFAVKRAHEVLYSAARLAYPRSEEGFYKSLVRLAYETGPVRDQSKGSEGAVAAEEHRFGGAAGFKRLPGGDGGPFKLRGASRRRGRGGSGKGIGLNELAEAEPGKQRVKPVVVGRRDQSVRGRKIKWSGPVDLGESIGHAGALAPRLELLAHGSPDGRVVQIIIYRVQGDEASDELAGGFLTDAGDPRYGVGAVAHERLAVNEAAGRKTVFFDESCLVILDGLAASRFCRDQLDVGGRTDELKTVAVARDDEAEVAGGLACGRYGTDDIVRLIALELIARYVHGVKHVLEPGKLLCHLVGHALAVGLVAGIHFVPEGGRLEIKGNAERVGSVLGNELSEYVYKAVYGVGVQPVGSGKGANAVKGSVEDAVAVEDHYFHDAHRSLPIL